MYSYGAWGGMQATPGVPPGWEAKWDNGSRRWFYIDHNTKTTHWEIPQYLSQQRKATPQPSQPSVKPKDSFVTGLKSQFPTASEDVIAQVLVSTKNNFIESKRQLESMGYQMKVEVTPDPKLVKQLIEEHISVSQTFAESLLRKHNNDMNAVRKALGEKGYRKKPATIQPLGRHVKTLCREYPYASKDVIEEVLVNNKNYIGNARSALEKMGFKNAVKPATVKQAVTPKATAPTELSEAVKKMRLEDLKKKFPSVPERLIQMSLEGTNYDTVLAGSVLKLSMDSVESKSSDAKASSGTSTMTESTSFQSSSLEPVTYGSSTSGFEPVVFGNELPMSGSFEFTPKISTTRSKAIPARATYSKPKSRTRDHTPLAKKMHMKKAPLSGYVSQNRGRPCGPNADLAHGPNSSLLQEYMIKPMGPSAMYRCGPQLTNCSGPDPANAQGSAGLALGAMPIETVI